MNLSRYEFVGFKAFVSKKSLAHSCAIACTIPKADKMGHGYGSGDLQRPIAIDWDSSRGCLWPYGIGLASQRSIAKNTVMGRKFQGGISMGYEIAMAN